MHNSRNLLRRERAALRLNQLAGFRKVPVLDLKEIPKERTKFKGTINDYWKELKVDGDVSSCSYELDSLLYFPTHIHKHNSESVKIVSEGSKVEWVTEEGVFLHKFGDTFTVAKGIKHALVNLSDFPLKIEVEWRPKMKGFNLNYK